METRYDGSAAWATSRAIRWGPDHEVEQDPAQQHGEGDAHPDDHAGADQEQARIETEAEQLPTVHLRVAGGRDQVRQPQVGALKKGVDCLDRPFRCLEKGDHHAGAQPGDQHVGPSQRLLALAVEAAQRRGCGDTRGERQFFPVDHLPLHRHRDENAEGRRAQGEDSHDQPRLVVALDQHERAKPGRDGRARRVAGGGRRRGHAGVFQHRHLREPPAGQRAQEIPRHKRDDHRGDGHAE
jgi:hypothetical protein